MWSMAEIKLTWHRFFCISLLWQAIMIGDDIVSDVGGAQQCGMRAVQVRTGKYRSVHALHPVQHQVNHGKKGNDCRQWFLHFPFCRTTWCSEFSYNSFISKRKGGVVWSLVHLLNSASKWMHETWFFFHAFSRSFPVGGRHLPSTYTSICWLNKYFPRQPLGLGGCWHFHLQNAFWVRKDSVWKWQDERGLFSLIFSRNIFCLITAIITYHI